MEVANGSSTNGFSSVDENHRSCFHLVALPYPGRGHINPMLNLCRHLAASGLLVTVVVTEEWLALLSGAMCPPLPAEVRLRSIPNVLPSERSRGADFATFIQAVLTKMAAPVAALLAEGLDEPADALVADSMLPWAMTIGNRLCVPVAALFPQAAAVFLALQEVKALNGQLPSSEIALSGEGNDFLKYLPRSSSCHFTDFISNSTGQSMLKTFIDGISWFSSAQCLLFNSATELETHALNILKSKLSVPIYSIGPSVPNMTVEDAYKDPYYKFLESQPENSVLYVSLGSFLPVSSEHVKEIAMGIKLSGHAFIWSLRDSADMEEAAGDKGIVVPWCDQLRVLCHPAVGGFLTHCGWNSTLESIHAGVPMLTYPLMWDQYPNSKLIVDEWKVGLRLKDEKEEGVIGREEIAKVIQKLMAMDSDESKDLRRRAKELEEKSRAAVKEQGSSRINADAFAHDVLHFYKQEQKHQ